MAGYNSKGDLAQPSNLFSLLNSKAEVMAKKENTRTCISWNAWL